MLSRTMCLIAFALAAHPRYSLVLAANRDEFHRRPTLPAAPWQEFPQIFGGRDLQQGGGWLALARDGRWAAVTNVRRMEATDPAAPSRGALVSNFLRGDGHAAHYAEQLATQARRYAGFNLLIGQYGQGHYLSNLPSFIAQPLPAGVHAVSNASLDTPWPKLKSLKASVADWCAQGSDDSERLFAALADTRIASDAELPDTGVGLDRERFLAPPFIRSTHYGTRASTVLLIGHDHTALFHERRYGANGVAAGETRELLQLDHRAIDSRAKTVTTQNP